MKIKLVIIAALFIFSTISYAEAPNILNISQTLIASVDVGSSVEKQYRVELVNQSTENLTNIKAIARHLPASISVSNTTILFGDIASGETKVGNSDLTIATGTANVTEQSFIVWEIIYTDASNTQQEIILKADL